MNAAAIRKKIKAGRPSIGSWLQLPSPDAAEIMARAGYDWLAVDMEHGSFGPDVMPDINRAIECGGAAPFARLPEAEKVWIKTALESGSQGLVFPMIESAEQLARAIDLATYPGQDTWRDRAERGAAYRGVGFCRANGFGKYFDDYRAQAVSNIFLAAQIEHIRAVENIEAILAHPRLDAIMVGPYDLSGSMGLTGQFGHPDFQAAMGRIALACRKCGIPMGCHVVRPDRAALQAELERGSLFVAYGIDTVFLWESARCPAVGEASCA